MISNILGLVEKNLVLSCVIGIIIIIGSYMLIKKYFRWIEQTTGYYPLNGINIFLLVLSIALPVINIIRLNEQVPSSFDLVLLLIPIVIIIVRNLKIKNPVHIVFVSLLQIFLSVIAIIFTAFAFVFASVFGGTGTSASKSNDNPAKVYVNGTAQSWFGHEHEIERANKLGFNSVQEAIEAGYAYDGRKI